MHSAWVGYLRYKKNKEIINNQNNVTCYQHKASFYLKEIKEYYIFKKNNFKINQYYWTIKTRNSQFYYTTTDDEPRTLECILKTVGILEFRKTIVSNFFEYCLISYLVDENITAMKELSFGNASTWKGALIKTQDFFTNKGNSSSTLLSDGSSSSLHDSTSASPDILIEHDSSIYVIDAYNGTSAKEIKKKINDYAKSFQTTNAYVFSSQIAAAEDLSLKGFNFKLFQLDNNQELKEIEKIRIGQLVIDIQDINKKYFDEYRRFYLDYFYWLNCEREGKIIKTQEN